MAAVLSFQYKSDEPLPEGLVCSKSIRLQEKGFSIALYHAETKTIHAVEQYDCEGCSLKEIIGSLSETEKKWDAKRAFLLFSNRINTQIPEKLHEDRNNDLYLPLLTKEPYQYQVMAEIIAPYHLFNISAWEKTVYQQITEAFPQYQLKSETTAMLRLLPQLSGKDKLLLFLEPNLLHLAAERDGQFLGANAFEFSGKNDFLYFLTGFAQTLFGDIESVDLHVMGVVESTSLLYAGMQKYFSRIHFVHAGYQTLQHQIHRFCDVLAEGRQS